MKKSQNMLVWLNKMVLTWHFGHSLLGLVKGTSNLNTCHRKYNKNDLTTTPCF
jgi:hypothetical protein